LSTTRHAVFFLVRAKNYDWLFSQTDNRPIGPKPRLGCPSGGSDRRSAQDAAGTAAKRRARGSRTAAHRRRDEPLVIDKVTSSHTQNSGRAAPDNAKASKIDERRLKCPGLILPECLASLNWPWRPVDDQQDYGSGDQECGRQAEPPHRKWVTFRMAPDVAHV